MKSDTKAPYAGLIVQEEIEAREMEFADSFGSDGFFEEALITCLQKIDRICAVWLASQTSNNGI